MIKCDDLKTFMEKSKDFNYIDKSLYEKYGVKNGLRNSDSTGVLVGLTKISDVIGYYKENDTKVDDYGKLIYRGIDLKEIIDCSETRAFMFEEVCFLILFGYLPNFEEFEIFKKCVSRNYALPTDFLETKILRNPNKNLMNKLEIDILTLFSYDDTADDISQCALLTKGLSLVSRLTSLICYNYMSKTHYFDNQSMYIHLIDEKKSISENLLTLLRSNKDYTKKEAELLDIILCLHADHGGGNNSTFSTVVISSTGTDIYSAFSASIGSLKGPKHGGANVRVSEMFDQVIKEIGYDASEDEIRNLIKRILNKDFYDNSGLIYGIGHAVYTLSDPRSEILFQKATELSKEKGLEKELSFYKTFEIIAKEEIYLKKGINAASNVDFYSGFVYNMLEIPRDLYTPLFVLGRSIGWLAHNIETNLYSGKIVRPATKYVGEEQKYIKIEER